MLNKFRERLRPGVPLTESTPPPLGDADPPPVTPLMADLVVYGEDSIVSGRLALTTERLSDALNGGDSFDLIDAMVEDFSGGPRMEVRNVAVPREDILLVHAGGPRGNPARRQHTRQHAIVAKVGPYEVRGYIHSSPGVDAITSIHRRKPMIALTDAIIEFSLHSKPQVRYADVVIVNRDAVDWVSEGMIDPVRMPLMPVRTGILVKDFTGDVAAG